MFERELKHQMMITKVREQIQQNFRNRCALLRLLKRRSISFQRRGLKDRRLGALTRVVHYILKEWLVDDMPQNVQA